MLGVTQEPGGFNTGRSYVFKLSSAEVAVEMRDRINDMSNRRRKELDKRSFWIKSQLAVRTVFNSMQFQCCVGLLLLTNFGSNAVESQWNLNLNYELRDEAGNPTAAASVLENLDVFFMWIFTLELAVNMYAVSVPACASLCQSCLDFQAQ